VRSMVNGDSTTECLPRIKVKDGDGTWIDLTDRLYSVSLDDSLEADSASVSLEFRNNSDKYVSGASNYNLDPLDVSSLYYKNSEPIFGRYHEVKLEVSKNDGVNYYEVFRGYAGPETVNVTTSTDRDDTITLRPCDLSFPYKEFHFYDSLIYKSADAVSIMTQIFTDHGFNETVEEVDAPAFHVEEVRTGETNVWAAQKALIGPTGYIYRIKWNEDVTSAFKPCVYDPDRTKTVPDAAFAGTFQHRRIDISEADVRTKVVVIYRHRDSGTIEYAQAESEAARDKYGIPDGSGNRKHKTMWLAVQGTGTNYSLIDTGPEAKDLADYVLYDLKEPVPDIEVRIPRIIPGIEIHDLLSFIGDDYTVTMGVTSVNWDWNTDNKIGTTTVRGTTDRVIGEFGLWLAQDAHSPEVMRDLQLAFLQGDGMPPAKPATPELLSFRGVDSATGKETSVVVATATPNSEWDISHYRFFWQIVGEAETESRVETKPRLVIKDLPVGATVKIWVQAVDWSASGLS